ncbi:acetylornithine carbamoyltransferase [Aliifodinibius salipaludis]|uniref:N-succinylornithine carbamoyltransferase n=1 Tax=Fodinibius salipaludis TaxID=2032627 RepID=A0A2A2G8W2_9BACT|nr:acetylornithine carbamoyltransferase [Aliifodinibius salipaludis]PAU93600.1 acetylornithine carbamoyltransferase [Aliifodinibius salipaludis]
MNNFTSVNEVANPNKLVQQVLDIKQNTSYPKVGENKSLALIFFNPSLRTRMSTQKAAQNIGMDVTMMNIDADTWNIEFENGTVMDGSTQEHIKDAVQIISGYCDLMGVRTFANLQNRHKDYEEEVLSKFLEYSSVPIISLESAIRHPLQSLADLTTIAESKIQKPKVVLSWVPHPKKLPQAVANSFLEWIVETDAEITLTHPKGYELSKEFTDGIPISNNQKKALKNADFIYAKNWSSYSNYGQTPEVAQNWVITAKKMNLSNQGKFMHCLPIRRNVVASDEVIDNSLVYQQAKNREHAAQAVLQNIVEAL